MADAAPVPPRRSLISRLAGFLVFLIAVAALGGAGYLFLRLKREEAARAALAAEVAGLAPKFDQRFDQFKAAVRDVGRELSSQVFQEVDFGASGWQPIAGGFYVIDLATSPAGKGTRIAGKVINPTSVTHESAEIAVRIGKEQAKFQVAKLPPGVAQPFEVTLPNVAPAAAHKAYIALEGSTISFASQTTRKRLGAGPVDTDKLLK